MRVSWWSGRAVKVHLTALVVVPGCAALCVWQVQRALSGNELSWAYVFEWPIFGAYAVFMWWRLLHAETLVDEGDQGPAAGPAREPATTMPQPAAAAATAVPDPDGGDDEDAELEEYNRYLAALHASGHRKHW